MMALKSAYCNGFPVSTTVEISKETQRSILCEIEAQLYDSEIYHRAMAALQTMLGSAAETAQVLVKAVGREAIRLAFQQVSKPSQEVVPVPSEEISSIKETSENPLVWPDRKTVVEFVQDNHNTNVAPALSDDNLEDIAKAFSPTERFGDCHLTKTDYPAQELEQKASEERQKCLHQIGAELRQARQARSLSVEGLHLKTFVPIRHIKALETGYLDNLPEDVYVRSFIRQLGNALGLNGAAMVASLPATDPLKSVLPSWDQPESPRTFNLSTTHLYFGYAALVVGAVGGIGWLSQATTSGAWVKTGPGVSSQKSPSKGTVSHTPGLKYHQKGISIGADIAPPEATNN